jgi:hypothetical protein
MKKGTKVIVNLSDADAKKLGMSNGFSNQEGEVLGPYINGVSGHYVKISGKVCPIADKYNALSTV